ncbi:MAG TPA: alpha/beta hydrolase [Burkholderiaceae bacterium]|jgi:pimeloyl-ACP methyl ester carboxylesterase|nr:alpha/beta hydrolase [Burkholderiaceae bacterium]
MKQSITVSGKKLEVNLEVVGDAGTPLLMVHGIPTNARLWRHVQAILGGRYRTFAMDLIGYGQSSMPLDGFTHTLTNQAEAVKETITSLGIKKDVVLIGHDHGGGVCQIVASKFPDHISRLVLVNPVSFDYWPVLEVEAFQGLVGAPDEVLQQAMAQTAAQLPALLRTGSYDKTAFTDQNIKQNYLQFWARGPGLTGFKSLIKIATEPTNKETLAVDWSKIKCPTLLCWALHDAWMPKQAAARIKAAMRAPVRLQYIERAGHYVQEDRPDVVADHIADFITEWQDVTI